MDPGEDPWQLLGVKRNAANVEIKFSFRKLAMEYHPDKQATEMEKQAAHHIFAKLTEAYEIVMDPVRSSQWKAEAEGEEKYEESSSSFSLDQLATPIMPTSPRGHKLGHHSSHHSATSTTTASTTTQTNQYPCYAEENT